jgi:hypothetical protein
MRETNEKELDWWEASKRLHEFIPLYMEIWPVGTFWLILLNQLKHRLDNWERSKELHEEIMNVE